MRITNALSNMDSFYAHDNLNWLLEKTKNDVYNCRSISYSSANYPLSIS